MAETAGAADGVGGVAAAALARSCPSESVKPGDTIVVAMTALGIVTAVLAIDAPPIRPGCSGHHMAFPGTLMDLVRS